MNRVNRINRLGLVTMAMIAACAWLAGCGQKGNLYLPNQKKKVPTTQAPPPVPAQPATPE